MSALLAEEAVSCSLGGAPVAGHKAARSHLGAAEEDLGWKDDRHPVETIGMER